VPVLEAMSKIWHVVGYDYGEASETTARPEDVTVEELVGEIFGVMGALGVERCTLVLQRRILPIAMKRRFCARC